MNTCPACDTTNSEGARFCSRCGQSLVANHSVETADAQLLPEPTVRSAPVPTQPKKTRPLGTDTQPRPALEKFEPRPNGAIFGDRFMGGNLIFSDELQHGYAVVEIKKTGEDQIEQCSNDNCGAIHVPDEGGVEKFCIRCGIPLSDKSPALDLFERPEPFFNEVVATIRSHLVHENIRPPLAVFQETVAGKIRYCLVTPHVEQLPASLERQQVMAWGETLALGLEYLHNSGLSFDGQIHRGTFGFANGKAVFSNFLVCKSQVERMEDARLADIRALATQFFEWLTGQSQYAPDVGLSPAVQQLFEAALMPPGFSTAEAFAQAWQEAITATTPPQAVEHCMWQSTDTGIARSLNEDGLFTVQFNKYLESVPYPLGVYVVADGMGGHAAGEVASGAIVNAIAQKVFSELTISPGQVSPEEHRKWIESAIQEANKVVFDMGRKAGSDMGSTVVMAVLERNAVHIGHVGDSRAYRISEQGIEALTTDHSLVERLVAAHQITREEAQRHPQRNVIYRTLGDKSTLEVDTATHILEAGDRLLLCSDGLNGMVKDEVIQQIVMEQSTSPQDACVRLIEAANAAGGDDNISVVVVELSGVADEEIWVTV